MSGMKSEQSVPGPHAACNERSCALLELAGDDRLYDEIRFFQCFRIWGCSLKRCIPWAVACVLAPAAWPQATPPGPVCKVTILDNTVGQPDDQQDGTVLLRVFVSTSTSCRAGQVSVAAYPSTVCRKLPQTDIDNSKPMTFTYDPVELELAVTPGNISTGVIEITSGDSGMCTFNTHVADCSGIAPAGGACEAGDPTDPQPEFEKQRGLERQFNRLR